MANDARHVVVLGIDGLRPDLVTESNMPHLAALAKDGTWNRRHTTVFPSETRGGAHGLGHRRNRAGEWRCWESILCPGDQSRSSVHRNHA
ncbi:alkaline phosphatase family protein [Sinorhizobium meliloti]